MQQDDRRPGAARRRRPALWAGRRPPVLWAAGLAVVVLATGTVIATGAGGHHDDHAGAARSTRPSVARSTVPAPPTMTAAAVSALPEARYDAVLPGLLPFDRTVTDPMPVFHLRADAPLYGTDRATPVARFAAADFLRQPTTVVGIRRDGPWELVLTPARQALPSTVAAGSTAAAQTAAWVPASALTNVTTPGQHVVVSTTAQTVAIVDADGTVAQSFPAAVGTSATPTPTGVTGYLEQRYVDAAQGTGTRPIQLTSLHSSAADEPYAGADGGLIGMHWYAAHTGAVSHGCIRLDTDAIAAVDALPLGTLVTIE